MSRAIVSSVAAWCARNWSSMACFVDSLSVPACAIAASTGTARLRGPSASRALVAGSANSHQPPAAPAATSRSAIASSRATMRSARRYKARASAARLA